MCRVARKYVRHVTTSNVRVFHVPPELISTSCLPVLDILLLPGLKHRRIYHKRAF